MIVIGVEGADQSEEEPSHHHVAPGMSLPHEPSHFHLVHLQNNVISVVKTLTIEWTMSITDV
jgi:hypothetical protein